MNDLEHLEHHLDFLIGILEVSDESIYNEIRYNDRFEYGSTPDEVYESSFTNYQNTLCTSAFILGFTQLEDYITKMVEKLFIVKPEWNPIKFTVKKMSNLGVNYISELAKEKAHDYGFGINSKLKLVNAKLPIPPDLATKTQYLRVLRNSIIHGNGYVSEDLANTSNPYKIYTKGDKIILTASDVNEYGIVAREYAKLVWTEYNNL